MALIGNGAQAEFQSLAMKAIVGINMLRLYDIEPSATEKAARNLAAAGMTAIKCATAEEEIEGAQIVTTCTADKQHATILTFNMIGAGIHINAIGGDCPEKTELHKDILLRASPFVKYAPQTCIEGEIQQMPETYPVKELWTIVKGLAEGRRDTSEITIF